MINGVNMAQDNVNFSGRFANMKEHYQDRSTKRKVVRIATFATGIAAIGAGIVVRKDIKTLFKTRNFKQFFKDAGKSLKNLGKSFVGFLKHPIKKTTNILKKEKPVYTVFSDIPGLSAETKTAMRAGNVEIANNIVKEMEASLERTSVKNHAKYQLMLDGLKGDMPISSKEFFANMINKANTPEKYEELMAKYGERAGF